MPHLPTKHLPPSPQKYTVVLTNQQPLSKFLPPPHKIHLPFGFHGGFKVQGTAIFLTLIGADFSLQMQIV